MNGYLRSTIYAVVGICGLLAVFTFVSSLYLMWSTSQMRFFVFPFNQWWFLFFQNWNNWKFQPGGGLSQFFPWIQLFTAAIIGLLIPIFTIKLALQRAGFFTVAAGFRTRTDGRR